jgi:hypothetical protein
MGFSIQQQVAVSQPIKGYLTLSICGYCQGGLLVLYMNPGGNTAQHGSPQACPSDPHDFG